MGPEQNTAAPADAEATTEAEPDVAATAEPDVAAAAEPDVAATAEPDVAATAEPDAAAAAVSESESRAEPEPNVVSEPESEPDVVTQSEPEARIVTEAEPETEAGTDPATEPATEPALERAAGPGTDPASEPDTDPSPEPADAIAGALAASPAADAAPDEPALVLRGVTKTFGRTRAVDAIDLTVPSGSFYGIVGPNGAGKTTTLSMIAGLLRPDAGQITVAGVDAGRDPLAAKRVMGILPDRLRTFERLTGRQLLYYYGVLRGLKPAVVEKRTADLARAFDLTSALGRPVSDYSAGMTKKVMLAGAMIHAPRVLVLDEPFEAVDPVSSSVIVDVLTAYVEHGGTVVLSSHGMELVERMCDRVAVIVAGQVLAEGSVADVRGELTLEQRFIELAGGLSDVEGLEWLHTFSD